MAAFCPGEDELALVGLQRIGVYLLITRVHGGGDICTHTHIYIYISIDQQYYFYNEIIDLYVRSRYRCKSVSL